MYNLFLVYFVNLYMLSVVLVGMDNPTKTTVI